MSVIRTCDPATICYASNLSHSLSHSQCYTIQTALEALWRQLNPDYHRLRSARMQMRAFLYRRICPFFPANIVIGFRAYGHIAAAYNIIVRWHVTSLVRLIYYTKRFSKFDCISGKTYARKRIKRFNGQAGNNFRLQSPAACCWFNNPLQRLCADNGHSVGTFERTSERANKRCALIALWCAQFVEPTPLAKSSAHSHKQKRSERFARHARTTIDDNVDDGSHHF